MYSHEDAEKSRRRKRDVHLKEQALAATKRRTQSKPKPAAAAATATVPLPVGSTIQDDDLPEDLPDDILALESRPQLLNVSGKQKPKANKLKRLDKQSKPVKDVKISHKNIRVLPNTNLSLPPAVVRQTANIKEAWLRVRAQESKKKTAGYRVRGGGARSFFQSQRT